MKTPADFAKILARKAEGDRQTAEVGLEVSLGLEIVAFHLQQAAEKWLKAALASIDVEYPKTHDLDQLLDLAANTWPSLTEFKEPLKTFEPYAVQFRYDEPSALTIEDLRRDAMIVEQLADAIRKLLPPEALP